MKKYEEPAMEVLIILDDDNIFTIDKSNGDGNSYGGEW